MASQNNHNKDQNEKTNISRRDFTKRSLSVGVAAGALSAGVTANSSSPNIEFANEEYEYVIVGSGAGGGPLAANLAKAGYSVLLLEAGDEDPSDDIHNIPAFHGKASEDPKMSWNFFVKHYADPGRQRADSKYVENKGILYPRASTIGGCTSHHAMITAYPHNNDFDRIAELTGDDSWDASKMRCYFERLENCQYVPRPLFPWFNPTRHGFDGWLKTNNPDLSLLAEDSVIRDIVLSAGITAGIGDALEEIFSGNLGLDLNNWRVARGEEGPFITPIAMDENKRRFGVRELLLDTRERHPDKLKIRTNAFATRVLFNEEKAAVGVEYVMGKSLYQADAEWSPSAMPTALKQVRATREVILSGGAFNSPQLLKLSGIGPAEELNQHGVDVLVDLPGVGKNLQDRYEVGVISELKEESELVKACTFGEGEDPCLDRYYETNGGGPYGTNGVIFSFIKRSQPHLPDPDLYLFGAPIDFKGYYPGYSDDLSKEKDKFTWLVLKGHTNNTAGNVTLKSNNPFEVPDIDFSYFDEGNDVQGDDLTGVIEGVRLARNVMGGPIASKHVSQEVWPGESLQSDEDVGEFVKNEAWGHHASCTNPIGIEGDPKAVLDSEFRVYGTKNLRVVDASVFPYIPGFFIVVPIYMISEKASDIIIETARNVG